MIDLIVGLVAERVERVLLRILRDHGVTRPGEGSAVESGPEGDRGPTG